MDDRDSSTELTLHRASRRRFLQQASALGIGAATLAGFSSVYPLRAHAQGAGTDTIVFGNAEPPTANYWDPAAGFGLVDEQVASLVYDTLLAFDADGEIQPHLASAYEYVDPTLVRLTLRTDARFHNGEPVTAEDVKASIERLGDGELAQSIVAAPGISVNILSPTEIEVTTPEPFGVMLPTLAFIKILPASYIAEPDLFNNGAMGSGPYRFVSYVGTDVTLEAVPDYWNGAPNVGTVIFRYIEDAQARTNALLSGQIDILTRASSQDIARVEGNDEFYINAQSPAAQIVAIYQHNGPMGDPKIREAVAHAIDREAIAASLMDGLNPVAYSSLPTNSRYYEEFDRRFDYDLDRARQLVAESSYPDGVTLRMSTSTLVPNQIEIDQVIAANLAQIGLPVDVERLEVGTFRSTYNSYDINLNTLVAFHGDPDFTLGFYTGPIGEAVFHYNNDEYTELYNRQRSVGPEERQAAVSAAAEFLWDNQVTLFLADEVWYSIVNRRVQDYTRAPLLGETLITEVQLTE